jgi:hypothetical protein
MHKAYQLTLILCLAFIPLHGCKQIKEERKHRLLEDATSKYRQAIRWGYYDAASQLLKHEEGAEKPPINLENIRVTGYEVLRPPVIHEADKAEQLVRIDYVLSDRQRLESLSDRQQWIYDQDTSSWWLASGLPAFKTDQNEAPPAP